ncbi:MAG: hypothetical protein OEL81_00885 [Nitrosopumilus sp.]|nr:hypothetical protein [Nitrosopumilus sp.]
MNTRYQIITTVIAILHWIYYGLTMLIVIINAETWFFGTKINGDPALMLHFSYGISGLIVGYLIYRQKRIAYVLAIILFAFMTISFRLQ